MHRRFYRWHNKGIWAKILEALVEDTDVAGVMTDASHVKIHLDATDAQRGNQKMGLTIAFR